MGKCKNRDGGHVSKHSQKAGQVPSGSGGAFDNYCFEVQKILENDLENLSELLQLIFSQRHFLPFPHLIYARTCNKVKAGIHFPLISKRKHGGGARTLTFHVVIFFPITFHKLPIPAHRLTQERYNE